MKRKWNEFYNWLIDHVPETVRIYPSSTIEKLKKRVKELYKQGSEFTPVLKSKAAKGYFQTYTITARGNYDPKWFLNKVERNVVQLIKDKLIRGIRIKMEKRNPATDEVVIESPHFRSRLKVILEKDNVDEYKEMKMKY